MFLKAAYTCISKYSKLRTYTVCQSHTCKYEAFITRKDAVGSNELSLPIVFLPNEVTNLSRKEDMAHCSMPFQVAWPTYSLSTNLEGSVMEMKSLATESDAVTITGTLCRLYKSHYNFLTLLTSARIRNERSPGKGTLSSKNSKFRYYYLRIANSQTMLSCLLTTTMKVAKCL